MIDQDCIEIDRFIKQDSNSNTDKILEEFQCQICLRIALNIRECPNPRCRRPFGYNCIKPCKKCPNCRESISNQQNFLKNDPNFNFMKNRLLNQTLKHVLQLNCMYKSNGCQEILQFDYEQVMAHQANCCYENVMCNNTFKQEKEFYDADQDIQKKYISEIQQQFKIDLSTIQQTEQQQQCEWIGIKKEFNDHQEQCGYKIVDCQKKPQGCQWRRNLLFQNFHYQETCEYVMRKCTNQYCKEWVLGGQIKNHENNCGFRQIQCGNNNKGCEWKSIQKQYNKHLQFECQFAIHCEICDRVFVNQDDKNLGKHKKEFCRPKDGYLDQKGENQVQKLALDKSEEIIQALQKQILEMRKEQENLINLNENLLKNNEQLEKIKYQEQQQQEQEKEEKQKNEQIIQQIQNEEWQQKKIQEAEEKKKKEDKNSITQACLIF